VHLVGGRGDVVLQVGAVALHFQEGHHSLARLAQLGEGGANFLRLAPADLERAHARHHRGDARVALCLGELGQERNQRRLLTPQKAHQEGRLGGLDVLAAHIDHESAPVRQLEGCLAASQQQHDPKQDENQERQAHATHRSLLTGRAQGTTFQSAVRPSSRSTGFRLQAKPPRPRPLEGASLARAGVMKITGVPHELPVTRVTEISITRVDACI
jgi:hypothetical protein